MSTAGRSRHFRPRPRLLLVACAVACLLSACGQGQGGASGLNLLPVSTAKGHVWKWDALCPYSPRTAGACAGAGPDIGPVQLSGDEWNLGGGTATPGSLAMSVGATGALAVQGAFPTTPPCTDAKCIAPRAYTWVRGFPSVLYGFNQCHGSTSPRVSPLLPLPMRVSAIPADLIGSTAYSLRKPRATYDIAYDLWLNKSATKEPCQTNGTVEVMVWFDYDRLALLPGSMEVAEATIPFAVNGITNSGKQAWGVFTSNLYRGGRTAPWGGTIWFIVNAADRVGSGSVRVDLSSVLSAAGTLLQNRYGWRNFRHSYWLDTIPFGMEYGPEDGTLSGSGSSYFSLKLSSYCLEAATTLSHTRCAGPTQT